MGSFALSYVILFVYYAEKRVELAKQLTGYLTSTLPHPVPDLNAAVDATKFPLDAALTDGVMLALNDKKALVALDLKQDFTKTILKQNPPSIVLRPHIISLLKDLRSAFINNLFPDKFVLYGQSEKVKLVHIMFSQGRFVFLNRIFVLFYYVTCLNSVSPI